MKVKDEKSENDEELSCLRKHNQSLLEQIKKLKVEKNMSTCQQRTTNRQRDND